MKRIMAHGIIYEGVLYRNHVAELADNGEFRIYPFREEIHSTQFINGVIEVTIGRFPPKMYITEHTVEL